jgi:hypothetical protein
MLITADTGIVLVDGCLLTSSPKPREGCDFVICSISNNLLPYYVSRKKIMLSSLTLSACLLALSALSSAGTSHSPAQDHANYIFNSVHHAMRQWGSSLDHNGMSIFFATVPSNTEFYHGTSSAQPINGTQWLAFEPEHALNFANCGRPGKGGPGRLPPGHSPYDGERPLAGYLRAESGEHTDSLYRTNSENTVHRNGQSPLATIESNQRQHDAQIGNQHADHEYYTSHYAPPPPDEKPCAGYLHTYRTRRRLRLLYVDGQSAAKSDKGTLDVQDLILRNPTSDDQSPEDNPDRGLGGPPGDSQRALELCNSVRNEWENKIDGILRMEAGFEIILCSFEDNLDVVSIKQQKVRSDGGPGSRDSGDQLSYYQAVAARFDGIGGHRVSLDYDSMISVFNYTNATYFDATGLPRVVNDSSTLKIIREDVRAMLTRSTPPTPSQGIDWQAITDLIVARYAPRIALLASEKTTSFSAFHTTLDRALRPFIDYSNRNTTSEVSRCAEQFLSPAAIASNTTAAISVKTTYTRVCQGLSDAAAAETLEEGLLLVGELKDWLGWTVWKKCIGCLVDEVCMIPIWPWGGKQDREQPRCSDMTDSQHGDYWGGFRGH